MDTMPTDTDEPRKDHWGFLRAIGVTKADILYSEPDIFGYPFLEHDKDGNAYGSDININDAPGELKVRPAEIDFFPIPKVEDIFYRLYVGKGTIEIHGDSDFLDYLLSWRSGEKIEIELARLEAVAETFKGLKAFHNKVHEAAEKFGFKFHDY
jgi:hypothetical protein